MVCDLQYKRIGNLSCNEFDVLLNLHKSFWELSNQPLFSMWSETNARATLLRLKDCSVGWVCFDGNKAIGFSIYSIWALWTVERMAYSDGFYVMRGFRNKKITDELMRLCLDDLEELKVHGIYISSTAGLDDTGANARAFNMLCNRFDFDEIPNSKVFVKKMFEKTKKIK